MYPSYMAFVVSCLLATFTFASSGNAETTKDFKEAQPDKMIASVEEKEMLSVIEKEHFFHKDDSQIQEAHDLLQPRVEIRQNSDGYHLFRYGNPYYIKGVGGSRYLKEANAAGANSVRTWSSKNIGEVLNRSEENKMTVLLGIWLSHKSSDYLDENYKKQIITRVRNLLTRYKNHSALLMWALGNEINLQGGDTQYAWRFVNSLAKMIKAEDVHHPVISVISYRKGTLNKIAKYAPDLDAVGINAYAALSDVRSMVDKSDYTGPYLITEWGVTGHWEAQRTKWGKPIEPTSANKIELYRHFYMEDILKNRDRCLGSYVFLWGQKQERTPTWYSMFIKQIPGTDVNDLVCATVDVMGYNWSGVWPSNRAPEVTDITINNLNAYSNVSLFAGQPMYVKVSASDSEQKNLRYIWEMLEEPVKLGVGGSREPRPATVGDVLSAQSSQIKIQAPESPGLYRLFVYVLDEQGHVGTANIPFQVNTYQAEGQITAASTSNFPRPLR